MGGTSVARSWGMGDGVPHQCGGISGNERPPPSLLPHVMLCGAEWPRGQVCPLLRQAQVGCGAGAGAEGSLPTQLPQEAQPVTRSPSRRRAIRGGVDTWGRGGEPVCAKGLDDHSIVRFMSVCCSGKAPRLGTFPDPPVWRALGLRLGLHLPWQGHTQ